MAKDETPKRSDGQRVADWLISQMHADVESIRVVWAESKSVLYAVAMERCLPLEWPWREMPHYWGMGELETLNVRLICVVPEGGLGFYGILVLEPTETPLREDEEQDLRRWIRRRMEDVGRVSLESEDVR